MAQQTAVEWLVEQINGKSLNKVTIDIPKELIEQAKAMEKEQILDAFKNGWSWNYHDPEQYYNETYGTS